MFVAIWRTFAACGAGGTSLGVGPPVVGPLVGGGGGGEDGEWHDARISTLDKPVASAAATYDRRPMRMTFQRANPP
jgi:hypothetical protein